RLGGPRPRSDLARERGPARILVAGGTRVLPVLRLHPPGPRRPRAHLRPVRATPGGGGESQRRRALLPDVCLLLERTGLARITAGWKPEPAAGGLPHPDPAVAVPGPR